MFISLILIFFFGFTIACCISTYVIYPLIVIGIGKLFPFSPIQSEETPAVSILIAAHNEEKDIRQKIKNTLELNYPAEKMEILIGSDGSTDDTAQIVTEFEDRGVAILDFKENRGKTAVQNDLAAAAKNKIFVFTDAASFLQKDALRNLVKPFADPRVGGVAGRMEFVDNDHNLTTESQGLYWKYEMKLRQAESSIGRLIGVDGPLYAIRREQYVPLASHIISDLMTPILVLKQRKKVVLAPDAIVYEEPTKKSKQEFQTRRRITLRGLIGIFAYPEILSPIKFPLLLLQTLLHKIIRWFVGPLVILNFIICILLSIKPMFYFFLLLHFFFYLAAIVGWMLDKKNKSIPLLKVPYYFCLVNLAATLGIFDFFQKKQAISWKPVRD